MWVRLCYNFLSGPVAQLVEQRIENPRVGSSILPQATRLTPQFRKRLWGFSFVLSVFHSLLPTLYRHCPHAAVTLLFLKAVDTFKRAV